MTDMLLRYNPDVNQPLDKVSNDNIVTIVAIVTIVTITLNSSQSKGLFSYMDIKLGGFILNM